jgi:predicted DNA-binding transcriptional regulator AlpA
LFALFAAMTGVIDPWLQLAELAELFGLSKESIKRLAKKSDFPLRRLTPYATPGVLQSELVRWLKAQPLVGSPCVPSGSLTQSLSAQTSPLKFFSYCHVPDRLRWTWCGKTIQEVCDMDLSDTR